MADFKSKVQQWLREIRNRIPERQVALAPSDAFFILPAPKPENLPNAELPGFAELTLEGNAPFPIEQLAWGYLHHPDSNQLLLFATPKARLRQRGFEDIEGFYHLFPGFVTLFGDSFEKPTIRFLAQDESITALHYRAGDPVPEKCISRKLRDRHLGDEQLLAERHKFVKSLDDKSYTIEPGVWRGTGYEITKIDDVIFHHRHVDETSPQAPRSQMLPNVASIAWASDLRDAQFASTAANNRRRGRFLWKAMLSAGVATVILLVFQLSIGILAILSGWQQSKIFAQEGTVNRIENKFTLAERLTRSTEEDIQPFVLLQAINPHRPESIYFSDVSSQNFNEILVEGESTEGVSPANAFSQTLLSQDFIAEVVENELQTRDNRTSFEFLIRFSNVPKVEIELPEEDEEVASDENENETADNGREAS